MQLSIQQGQAKDKVVEWYNGGASSPQVFRLFGYAGTGKTTIAKDVVASLSARAVFGAYTGKAASVLRKKGNPANTIHSLIYKVNEPDEEKIHDLKQKLEECKVPALRKALQREFEEANKPTFSLRDKDELKDIDLIVIDEVSMVGEQLGQDLLSFDKKILVLGDPAQLPPIDGGGFFTSAKPDFLLTEIHRQARDNPIITMATLVRQGHRLKKGSYGDSKCIDRREENEDPSNFEQLIVGLNRTRKDWNARYRDLFGWTSSTPEQGEKVICLKNNKERGLLNGTQWRVGQAEDRGYAIAMEIFPWEEEYDPTKRGLLVEAHQFDTDFKQLMWYERSKAEEFDFGYAITCHKAQGSQWKTVYIANESYVFAGRNGKPDYSRNWLYTALTRAEERVVVAL